MDVINFESSSIEDEIETLRKLWNDYDFFFLHIKKKTPYARTATGKEKSRS